MFCKLIGICFEIFWLDKERVELFGLVGMIEPRDVRECQKPGYVMSLQDGLLKIPEGWTLLPPGDATMSRRIKKAGPCWTMKKRKGSKWFSLGIWADAESIERIRLEVAAEKQDPAYKKRIEAGRVRREKQQELYAQEFEAELVQYLNFAHRYQSIGEKLAKAISAHAVPVGSGTVARTKRIPIEERVEAATIAWMRHQTTAYDEMHIPMVKGKRREVRRRLAKRSKQLLDAYRNGYDLNSLQCPLAKALK